MLPKDDCTDNSQIPASTGTSAESGNSLLARCVVGRYTKTTAHGRFGGYLRVVDYPRLAGEKSLALAGVLMRRWKSDGGGSSFPGHPLPFQKRVSLMRVESGVYEYVASDQKLTRRPDARAAFLHGADSHVTDTGKRGEESSLGRSLTALRTTDDISPNHGVKLLISNHQGTAGQPTGLAKQQPSDVASPDGPDNRSGSGPGGEIIPNGNSNGVDHFFEHPSAAGLSWNDQSTWKTGREIMARHNRPTLVRLYRQASDDFHSIRGKAALSETIAASHRYMLPGDSAERRETAVNGTNANPRLLRSCSPVTGSRLSRQSVETSNSIPDLANTLHMDKGPTAGRNGKDVAIPGRGTVKNMANQAVAGHYSKGSDISDLIQSPILAQAPGRPAGKTAEAELSLAQRNKDSVSNETGEVFNTSAAHPVSTVPLPFGRISPLRNSPIFHKMQTAPIISRFHDLSVGGLRTFLTSVKTPSSETCFTVAGSPRFSARQKGTPVNQQTGEGVSSHLLIDAETSGRRMSIANETLPVSGLTGAGPFLAEKTSTSAPGILLAKTASTSISNPGNNSGRTATGFAPKGVYGAFMSQSAAHPVPLESSRASFILRRREDGGLFQTDRFEPLSTQGIGNMPIALNYGTEGSPYRSFSRFTESSILSKFPSQSIAMQGESNFKGNNSGSVYRSAASYTGLPFSPSFRGAARLSPSRDMMPLVKRKGYSGSELPGTGNIGATDRFARQHDLSGSLRRSAERNNGGRETATMPAAASIPSASVPPAGPSADGISTPTFDLERVADEVYLIIERRLIAEKERKGL